MLKLIINGWSPFVLILIIEHVSNISAMQFLTGISRNTQSKSYATIDWVYLGFPK